VALTLSATLAAASPIYAASASLTATSLLGVDSNVFLSDVNPSGNQQARSSTFTQTTLGAEIGTDPSRAHRIVWSLQGLHKHYFQYGEADKLFAESALAYRYAVASSLLLGVVHTFSYARLQLLDTEGNTLPRDRFIAYSGDVRWYAQWLVSRSRLTLGAGLRRKDINEAPDTPTTINQSLDHQGYFIYFDGVHRLRRMDLGLGYEYGVLHYNELQARDRDSSNPPASNPILTLIQHTARAQLAVQLSRSTRVSLDGQARWTNDPFDGELTYRQYDVQPRGEVRLPFKLLFSGGAGYRTRSYDERLVSTTTDSRRERFLQADASLRRPWTDHLAILAQAQFLRKISNAPGDEFRERIYALGISLRF
jgi:hypothetical protein